MTVAKILANMPPLPGHSDNSGAVNTRKIPAHGSPKNGRQVRFYIPGNQDGDITDEVPELFTCIRDATQHDLFEMGDSRKEPANAFYEVLYLGRAKVNNKKVTSNHVDDLVQKLSAKEEERKRHLEEELQQRTRHASGASVSSLPATLENSVSVSENDLLSQQENFRGAEIHNHDSPGSSADDLSDAASSSENILDSSGGLSNSGDLRSLRDLKDDISDLHREHVYTENNHVNACHMTTSRSTSEVNRTMLFRLGAQDISLISLDKKSTSLEKKFTDISSVSQGTNQNDVFGFIGREKGNIFLCHLMRCHSGAVVDEIMTTLRGAFMCAYEQNRNQICIYCPLHQLHRLCQEISGLTSQAAYELISRRIQQLPEKDTSDIFTLFKSENPQSYDESVEVLMIGLRSLCEIKQKEHTHISDGTKMAKPEFNLVDTKCKSAPSAFDNLKNKAKKRLAHSFENLLTRNRRTEDARDAFRHRSGTNDSESSYTGHSVDSSGPCTPDGSPIASPASRDMRMFNYPSPPSSPNTVRRPRSSTLGAIPDAALSSAFLQTARTAKRLEVNDETPTRLGSNSPMRQIYLLAGSGGRPDSTSSSCISPLDDVTLSITPQPRGSWRQAIFNRVVTPVRHPLTPTFQETDETFDKRSMTSQQIRALWKKAILETLLLIRMEKENQCLRARQNKVQQKRQKLDYQEITPCLKDVTTVWEEMLQTPNRATVEFDPKKLLSCVKQGVPRAKRGDIWWMLVEQHRLRYSDAQKQTPDISYMDLLRQLTTHQHAILIDLGRTFPTHPYFSTQLGPGQLSLFNLLKAYSLLDQEVGYCQGISFVAGILLMHMEETIAFETLRHMMFNQGLRKQYTPNMISLQIQLYQLTRLIHDNYKDLYEHFEAHEIGPTLYAAPWFLTMFASQFPLGFVSRVFDLMFLQGVEVIFKAALVLLGNHRELIMQCDSFETIVEFIKTTLPEMTIIQMERVINQVFKMDISKQLQAYEVEYHVLREEMLYSPQRGEFNHIHKLEHANRNLKNQNMELLEKLQNAHSNQHSLEITLHNYHTNEAKLKSHIRTLELERAALLNAVSKLRQVVPETEVEKLEISLPVLLPSLPQSPMHQPVGGGLSERGQGDLERNGAK